MSFYSSYSEAFRILKRTKIEWVEFNVAEKRAIMYANKVSNLSEWKKIHR